MALALCFAIASLQAARAQPPEAPPSPRFEIRRFVVEGNTLLAPETVERILSPHTGRERDFGDVQRALEALQDEYLERGYSAVRVLVPEQDIRAGVVRLEVIEARVGRVLVEGHRHFGEAQLLAAVPALRPGESPNARAIGRSLQLANENPARKAVVQLRSTEDPRRVDAVLRVTDSAPVRWVLGADDTGNVQTGRYRVGLGYVDANFGGRDHVLSLQAITSPEKPADVFVIGAGYRIPFYRLHSALELVAGYSDVDSGTVQNLFTVTGKGTVLAARWSYVLPRFFSYEHKLVASLDWRDFHQNVQLVGGGGGLLPDLRLRPLGLGYVGRYSRVGYEANLYVGYVHNLAGGKDGGQDTFSALRAGANARYSLLRYGAQASGVVGRDFLLTASLSGQHTGDALVPQEQFGMGGAASVRGFFEREASADTGHRASLELLFPEMGQHMGAGWRARFAAFVDAARGRDNVPVRSDKHGLASVGIGLRLGHGEQFSARLDWAHVVNGTAGRPAGYDRLHFSLAYSF